MLLTEKQSNSLILAKIFPVFNIEVIKMILRYKKALEYQDIITYYKICNENISKTTYKIKYPLKRGLSLNCFSKKIAVYQSYPTNKKGASPLFSTIRCFYPGYFKNIKMIPNNAGTPTAEQFHMSVSEKIKALNKFHKSFTSINKYIDHYSLLYVHQKKWILQIQTSSYFNTEIICLCYHKGNIFTLWNHNL